MAIPKGKEPVVRLMTGDSMTTEVVPVSFLTRKTQPIDRAELRILLIRSGITPVTIDDVAASDIETWNGTASNDPGR